MQVQNKQVGEDVELCPACNGNDKDAPCAYPSEGKQGCLREINRRLAGAVELRDVLDGELPGMWERSDFM